MKAIRGATTVSEDNAEQIRQAVKELLLAIKEKNSLNPEQIICIIFSNTADLRSFYPAKAAREAGFSTCALFSAAEPEIDGSLKKCIRVMLLAEIQSEPKHVYLNGAVNLRRDLTKRLNIAVDGPAGSGKSTVSHLIASRFGILHLDTGAMYRAVALACLENKVDFNCESQVNEVLNKVNIDVEYDNGTQKTLIDGSDVSSSIRTPEISMLASKVSSYECVRRKMVALQRQIAAEKSCVLDGRDIGSNVLPGAEFKFYLTASDEVRAARRERENTEKGIKQPIEEVLAEIRRRDEQDKNRKIAPLIKADDALEVDTSKMTIEEVVNFIVNKIQEKI